MGRTQTSAAASMPSMSTSLSPARRPDTDLGAKERRAGTTRTGPPLCPLSAPVEPFWAALTSYTNRPLPAAGPAAFWPGSRSAVPETER